jgi:tRNA dimethylallyltransferase
MSSHPSPADLRPPPVIALLGPTASGKSALGLQLAERLGGEIICCDSMQVYRGMDIGTAKATPAERGAIPHHLLDVASPVEQFHAAAWADAAHSIVVEMAARERLPIIVGGTGLYFRALVRGLFEAPKPDAEIRARHQAEAASQGTAALHARLCAIDPEAAAKIHSGDLLRISRALEVFEQTGTTISELRRQKAPPPPPLRMFSIVLDFDLELLRPRIAARVDAMMNAGFLDEVRGLREAGFADARSMQALGYKQLGEFLDGKCDLDSAVAAIKTTTAAYARRQRTWFRSEAINLRVYQPLVADPLAHLLRGWLLT